MELTFVNQYSSDAPKRRRLAKACETCRARKKRCIHFASAEDPDQPSTVGQDRGASVGARLEADSSNEEERRVESVNGVLDSHDSTEVGGQHSSPARSAPDKRFISDLTPESTFLNIARSARTTDQRLPNNDIGVWVDKREWEALVQQKTKIDSTFVYSHGMRGDQRPHSAVLGPLIDIFFAKIHPILPLMDEAEFRESYAEGILPEPLAHALCLVAAKDPDAGPHLKLGQTPSTLQPREFCSRLHASIMGSLRVPCQYEKVTLIRILALASLHNEGAEGAEEASMCLSQAMHHAQTLGIHLGQHSGPRASNDASMKRLFWCLYALDRMNSAINGRPIIMSDIDIAIEKLAPGESGFPTFDVWLRVTDLLNKIIAFYRPGYPTDVTGWEEGYPGLEELFDDCKAWDVPESFRATVHLFYLACAILSHRSRGVKQIPRGTPSSVRQRLCAIEIVRLMESDYSRELHQLSIIPYAVSLALSVSYGHIRQSQLRHQQEDGRSDFRACCRILQSLRRTWSSADTMAILGKRVLDELDKAPTLASFRIRRNLNANGNVKNVPCMPDINGKRTGLEDVLPNRENGPAPGAAEEQPPANSTRQTTDQVFATNGGSLFDGMDDIFDTYLDPNYPVNLDDLTFVDDMQPFDWNEGYNRQCLGKLPGPNLSEQI